MHQTTQIILYYKFVPVSDPEAVRRWQTLLGAERGLRGRVIVASDGINGTLGGDTEALQDYIEHMEGSGVFDDIVYKWSDGSHADFPKLSVKHRKELVTLDPDTHFDSTKPSTGLTPQQWHDYIANNPDVPILDARNNYESAVGKFKGAITPDIKTFKEIKPHLDKLNKDKPLLTYCTGDIRCEYLSAYMQENGFKEVYHLDGGIVKYGQQFKDSGYWDGKCFVFDDRMTIEFDENTQDIGECEVCEDKTSEFVNCDNLDCNRLFVVCSGCQKNLEACTKCLQPARARQ